MAIHKILLFYRFTPLADPEAVRLWQHTLGESLGLGGRILLSKDGINGTVGDQEVHQGDQGFRAVPRDRLQVERGHRRRLPPAERQGARRDRQLRRPR
jgi:hypothetical protein